MATATPLIAPAVHRSFPDRTILKTVPTRATLLDAGVPVPQRAARGGRASGGWPVVLYNDKALVIRDHSYLPRLTARLGKTL